MNFKHDRGVAFNIDTEQMFMLQLFDSTVKKKNKQKPLVLLLNSLAII